MSRLTEYLQLIPIKDDVYSWIMLFGIYQGIFLSGILLLRYKRANRFTVLSGIYFFILTLLLFDNFLCYTGRMKYVLFINDASEFTTWLLAPLPYLILNYLVGQFKPLTSWKFWIHLMPSAIYLCYSLFFIIQPLEAKYNAYKDAYHPELDFINISLSHSPDPLGLKSLQDTGMMTGLIIYGFLMFQILQKTNLLWPKTDHRMSKKNWATYSFWILIIASIVVAYVAFNYNRDSGDHYLSILLSITILLGSKFVYDNSKIFDQNWFTDKYFRSNTTLKELQIILNKATQYLNTNPESYTQANYKIDDLARAINTPTHDLSRAINQIMKINWNDFINQYRIVKVQEMLIKGSHQGLSIEGLGQQVGFKSKSSFYAAFKKNTLLTPLQWLKSQN